MMKRLLFVLLIMGVIGACYAVIAPETHEQIEKRLSLPPQPTDKVILEGILEPDVDKDEIRDDLKNRIAFALPNDPQRRRFFEREAYLWTQMVKNKGNRAKLIEFDKELDKLVSCKVKGIVKVPKELFRFDDYITVGFDRAKLNSEIRRTIGDVPFKIYSDESLKKYYNTFK